MQKLQKQKTKQNQQQKALLKMVQKSRPVLLETFFSEKEQRRSWTKDTGLGMEGPLELLLEQLRVCAHQNLQQSVPVIKQTTHCDNIFSAKI